jgi:hypothetical protein
MRSSLALNAIRRALALKTASQLDEQSKKYSSWIRIHFTYEMAANSMWRRYDSGR